MTQEVRGKEVDAYESAKIANDDYTTYPLVNGKAVAVDVIENGKLCKFITPANAKARALKQRADDARPEEEQPSIGKKRTGKKTKPADETPTIEPTTPDTLAEEPIPDAPTPDAPVDGE